MTVVGGCKSAVQRQLLWCAGELGEGHGDFGANQRRLDREAGNDAVRELGAGGDVEGEGLLPRCNVLLLPPPAIAGSAATAAATAEAATAAWQTQRNRLWCHCHRCRLACGRAATLSHDLFPLHAWPPRLLHPPPAERPRR